MVARRPETGLASLSRREADYWAIREAMADMPVAACSQVLDVGSGLGYLVGSLAALGFDARGIDESAEAVMNATRLFGPRFERAGMAEYAQRLTTKFDCVIMAEVLEHVPEPHSFIEAAKSALAAEGRIVITTPDREYFPSSAIWETDLPPVHLWWFSRESVTSLAARTGLRIRFVDFTPYAKRHPPNPPKIWRNTEALPTPVLDRGGRVISRPSNLYRILLKTDIYDAAVRVRDRYRRSLGLVSNRHEIPVSAKRYPILCAVLTFHP